MLQANQVGKKILLVDDDFVLGEILSLMLGGDGYQVAIAPNGQEALRRLQGPEPPHLILLDLGLPVMDGSEFRQRQRQDPALAAIPTVVFSAAADAVERAADLGATDCLRKPVPTRALLDAVRRYCGRPGTAGAPDDPGVPAAAAQGANSPGAAVARSPAAV
jgi:CheY-like chemotaxis protein